jgi:ABC-type uncharacterized transport system permease subunit
VSDVPKAPVLVTDPAGLEAEHLLELGAAPRHPRVWAVAEAIVPILLGMAAAGLVLIALGRNPFAFYADVIGRGLLTVGGFQASLARMAPLLLMAGGLIIAFRTSIWNIGGDGQFLMAAAVVAGLSPALVGALPRGVDAIVLGLIAAAVGGVWTIVPAYLKAWYGINEIITSLMMSFVGINLANLLIKGPFRSTTTNVPQTSNIQKSEMLPTIPGTRVHVGLVVALLAILVIHYVMTRTSFGLRLSVIGANPRTAAHVGINVRRLIVIAFMLSGAFMGMAAAVEILGMWGYVRADWNPGFGLPLFALVFLARLNALATIPLVAFYSVLSIGGHYATRQADLPDDFMLMVVGLILLFMTLTELLGTYVGRRQVYLTPGLKRSLKPRSANE